MLTISLWIVWILILWIYILWSRRKYYQLSFKFPNDWGYPVLGNLISFYKSCALYEFEKGFQKFGRIYIFWFGPKPVLLNANPQISEELLNSPYMLNKPSHVYNIVGEILGDSIVTVNEHLWSKHRKIFNSAFNHNILVSFMPIFNNEVEELMGKFEMIIDQGEQHLISLLKSFTLRTTIQTAMGEDVKQEAEFQNNSLVKSYRVLFNISTKVIVYHWLNIKIIRIVCGLEKLLTAKNQKIRNIIRKLIYIYLAKDRNLLNDKQKNIFISLATNQLRSGVFTFEDVENSAHTFVMASFKTTALTIGYTLMLLAMHPVYQERVYEELRSVFPEKGNFQVTYGDIQKLSYLEMVLNESMRLFPVFPMAIRELSDDIKLSNGTTLPKGLAIIFCIFHLHRHKDTWGPQSNIFNPDNFALGNQQNKHPFAFMPFFKGKRNCIGWKYAMIFMKVTLAKLLRNYKFLTSFRYEDLKIVNNISLELEIEPALQIQRRS